jgi:hypothetical protein
MAEGRGQNTEEAQVCLPLILALVLNKHPKKEGNP